jgi:hypothetical protein
MALSDLIGWRQTMTSSPANHIPFPLVRAKEVVRVNVKVYIFIPFFQIPLPTPQSLSLPTP